MADDSLPLHDLLVVDLTRVLAGPYCTRLLSDLGARVIKIERPIEGDEMRRNPHQIEAGRDDQSTYFARVNAGKESVAVDLSRPEGRDVVLGLVRHADVFIENFAPGVAGKLGLAYDPVARREARYRLLLDLGLRPDRAVARAPRLRPHHQRRLRHDGAGAG